MSVDDCPHCGKPAIGYLAKSVLGPARATTCKQCGGRISVAYSSIWTMLPIFVGLLGGSYAGFTGGAFWGLLLALTALSTLLYWQFARLVPR